VNQNKNKNLLNRQKLIYYKRKNAAIDQQISGLDKLLIEDWQRLFSRIQSNFKTQEEENNLSPKHVENFCYNEDYANEKCADWSDFEEFLLWKEWKEWQQWKQWKKSPQDSLKFEHWKQQKRWFTECCK